jgi:hypothetical protein
MDDHLHVLARLDRDGKRSLYGQVDAESIGTSCVRLPCPLTRSADAFADAGEGVAGQRGEACFFVDVA